MATERRLIDANEFINRLENTVYDTPTDFGYSPDLIKTVLEQTKTVDAVEVVRCRDCKHYMEHPRTKRMCCYVHLLTPHHMRNDDFCSYGERRTDA